MANKTRMAGTGFLSESVPLPIVSWGSLRLGWYIGKLIARLVCKMSIGLQEPKDSNSSFLSPDM